MAGLAAGCHALGWREVATDAGVDPAVGLAEEDAALRVARFGRNQLPPPPRRTVTRLVLRQFQSPLIYLLAIAAALAGVVGHVSDAFVILVVIALNAALGAIQEGRAERSLETLRGLSRRLARVLRGGREIEVEAAALVPGDILVIVAGDAVLADARLVDGAALQVAEAPLTGESTPVPKSYLPLASDTPVADRTNMVFAGTHVTVGRAHAIVVATGTATEVGKIAALAEGARQPPTPLETRVAQFGRWMVVAAVLVFGLVVAVGRLRGLPFHEIFLLGISQLVGMVPEGLPAAMTIALAVGVQRMARRNAIVRRLAAVETLGATTVICSDKTGTLTRNEMMVSSVWLPGGKTYTVTGSGYEPKGSFVAEEDTGDAAQDEDLRGLLEAGVLCSDAGLTGPCEDGPRWRAMGDPTEVALVVAAMKAGILPDELRARHPRRAEIPFDAERGCMATQHVGPAGDRVVVKGAPEVILGWCHAQRCGGRDVPLDGNLRGEFLAAAERMGRRALRVLAAGVVDGGRIPGTGGTAAFEGKVTLLGMWGQMDPPREEAANAVARCTMAGIRPVMVTGDHRATGLAVARMLGMAGAGAGEAVDGRELECMNDAELDARIPQIAVFARVHPLQKLRIVDALQRRGEVVAMTGDGVNDAPALAKADVGVAMGRGGTEVARESAKIVIADDHFATIVAAVEEGRVASSNIRKAVLLLFSTSAAEVLVLAIAMAAGYPPPFVAVQILWNNLVTEGLVTVNLIMDPPEGDEMTRPPVAPREPLLNRAMLMRMFLMTPAIVTATLGWFLLRLGAGIPEAVVRTEAFTLLVVCEWFNVLNCRSATRSALSLSVFRNRWLLAGMLVGNLLHVAVVFWPPFNRLFHTTPLRPGAVIGLGLAGSLVLWVEEARKFFARRAQKRARMGAEGEVCGG